MTTLYADNLTITEPNTKLTTLYNGGGGTLVLPPGEETYTAAIGLILILPRSIMARRELLFF